MTDLEAKAIANLLAAIVDTSPANIHLLADFARSMTRKEVWTSNTGLATRQMPGPVVERVDA